MVDRLQAETHILQEQITGIMKMPSPAPGPHSVSKFMVPSPECYDGTCSKFHGFINQCRLLFKLQPYVYTTDQDNLGLVISLFIGETLDRVYPLLEQDLPVLANWDSFLEAFAMIVDDAYRAALQRWS